MKFSLFLSLLFLVFSCGKFEELDKRTETMEDDMKGMKKTTESMDKKMENMDRNTELVHRDNRQGFSSLMRNEEFRNLREEGIGIGAKLIAGQKLFYAFEHQLWTGVANDTEEVRNILFKDAFDEVYQSLSDFHRAYDPDDSVVFIDSASTDYQAFNVIAATMHFNNEKQEQRLHSLEGIEVFSIYSLIERALHKYYNNQELNEYEKVIRFICTFKKGSINFRQ